MYSQYTCFLVNVFLFQCDRILYSQYTCFLVNVFPFQCESIVYSQYTCFLGPLHIIKNLFLLSWFLFFPLFRFLCNVLSVWGCFMFVTLWIDCFMYLSGSGCFMFLSGLTVCCFCEIMHQLYCFCLVMIDCLLFLSGFGSTFMFQSGYRSTVLCLTGYGSPVSQGTKSSESSWCVLRGCNFRELPSRHMSYHE